MPANAIACTTHVIHAGFVKDNPARIMKSKRRVYDDNCVRKQLTIMHFNFVGFSLMFHHVFTPKNTIYMYKVNQTTVYRAILNSSRFIIYNNLLLVLDI